MTKISFSQQEPEVVLQKRLTFSKGKIGQKFLQWLGDNHYLDAYCHRVDMTAIREGRIPTGMSIHHIWPLSGGGDNGFENLVLIENRLHQFIHQHYYNPKLLRLQYESSVVINVPDFKDKVALFADYQQMVFGKVEARRRQDVERRKVREERQQKFAQKVEAKNKLVQQKQQTVVARLAALLSEANTDMSYLQALREPLLPPTQRDCEIMKLLAKLAEYKLQK